jgi:uncharacterized protein (DUF58 family)
MAQAVEEYRRFLDPELLGAVSRLDFQARKIVEGARLGLHRSPYHGISVEFAEHRQYVPGDDVRHLDWKIYAKRDRFFVKQYEEETNLAAHFLVDVSRSMQYRPAAERAAKLDYAKYVTAALAYLLTEQGDSVGLAAFDSETRVRLSAKSGGVHFRLFCEQLAGASGGERTDLGAVLARLAAETDRRGLAVVVSDFIDDAEKVVLGLHRLAARGHDVVALHVADGDELEFPFRGTVRFDDLEGAEHFTCDAGELRRAYLDAFQAHAARLRAGCRQARIDYALLDTREPLDVALTGFLCTRSGRRA